MQQMDVWSRDRRRPFEKEKKFELQQIEGKTTREAIVFEKYAPT